MRPTLCCGDIALCSSRWSVGNGHSTHILVSPPCSAAGGLAVRVGSSGGRRVGLLSRNRWRRRVAGLLVMAILRSHLLGLGPGRWRVFLRVGSRLWRIALAWWRREVGGVGIVLSRSVASFCSPLSVWRWTKGRELLRSRRRVGLVEGCLLTQLFLTCARSVGVVNGRVVTLTSSLPSLLFLALLSLLMRRCRYCSSASS